MVPKFARPNARVLIAALALLGALVVAAAWMVQTAPFRPKPAEHQIPAQALVQVPGKGAATQPDLKTATAGQTVVFYDSNLDPGLIRAVLHLQSPNLVLIALEPRRNAFDQIAQSLAGKTGISSIHIVTHGETGGLNIAGEIYDTARLQANAATMQRIGHALVRGGDILIYGCDVAEGAIGHRFIAALARLTGVDVAASTNATGGGKGADWILEAYTGSIEAPALRLPRWTGALWTTELWEGAWYGDPFTAPNPNYTSSATPRFTSASSNLAGPGAGFQVVPIGSSTAQRVNNVTATTYAAAVTGNDYFYSDFVVGGSTVLALTRITFNQVSANGSTSRMTIAVYDPVSATLTPITPTTGTTISGSSTGVNTTISTAAPLIPGRSYQLRFYFWNCTASASGVSNVCYVDNPSIYTSLNQNPVAVNDSFTTPYATTLTGNVTAANPTTADSDPEGQTLTVDQINGATYTVGTPIALANGTLTMTNANGAFTFAPAAGFVGTQTFTYRLNDGYLGTSNTATVTITVSAPTYGITLSKVWNNAIAGNAVSLSITGASGAVAGASTAGGTATSATATGTGGATITLTEAFTSGTASNYGSVLDCTKTSNGASIAVSGSGLSRTITMPMDSAITCRWTNSRPTVTLRKSWVSAISGNAVNVTATGLTSLASTAGATDKTDSGAAQTVTVGSTLTIAETYTSGSAANYASSLSCTGAVDTNLADGLTINVADTAIVCTWTNTRVIPITVQKTSSVVSDPVNGTTNPKLIPGATIRYCILVTNPGTVPATSIVSSDPLPANIAFISGSMRSGTTCATAATVEDDDNTGTDESDPFGMSYSGTTVTGIASSLAAGATFAMVFDATIN
ncbi:MAG: DUF4347 domain-containing protein [Proteobacteria bacterium]|nr:DUF4347 domain-containing protein [Pseudomonadota bacterium]